MWLLNSCTWEMKEFISHKQAPPYAILSHTWGDEEISFREWQREPMDDVGRKGGFTKIKYCCQQAASDGLEWIWVDTSAELSEAINSMFRWYENATICYAYLCDISHDSEVDLAKARWVTRGWTLQELIAPPEIVFYSNTWQHLGTRSELSYHLATVTGIDEPFLTGRSLDKASIAQRMSWAAKRKTAREEDIAYCLLGIFNVNMPLIYGEGPTAFRRLQETLVREYPYDHSLFAWGKVVERVSNFINTEVHNVWKTSGTREIKHEPDNIDDGLLGLFAESPTDFEHSGRIVIAPTATQFFSYTAKGPSVSSLVGRSAYVKLPVFFKGHFISSHMEYPPIVRINYLSYIVILCGQWDNLRTKFCYAAIPIVTIADDRASRTEEIVVGAYGFDELNCPPPYLMANVRKCIIAPQLLTSPRATDIVMKRHVVPYRWSRTIHMHAEHSRADGYIKSRKSLSGMVFIHDYSVETEHKFMIAVIRLDKLNHSHDDPTQGRECGKLRFALLPFIILPDPYYEIPPLTIIDRQGGSKAPTAKEEFQATVFRSTQEGISYCFEHWEDIRYTHDMATPQDEWSITISGIADINISVERIFLDEYDSDHDESTEDESHLFVDVLDIVIRRNRDKSVDSDSEEDDIEEDDSEDDEPTGDEHTKDVT
ncbi:hypothetical protein F5Y03DRAFT_396698 [Xylaria venustula]|nr:hypothetical protein F5Y03DRAFT_396698 [Xylaria venustula]